MWCLSFSFNWKFSTVSKNYKFILSVNSKLSIYIFYFYLSSSIRLSYLYSLNNFFNISEIEETDIQTAFEDAAKNE